MQYADFKIYIVWYTKQCTFTLFPNVKNKLKCLKDQKKVQFKKNTGGKILPTISYFNIISFQRHQENL